jgi:hypothetical protein
MSRKDALREVRLERGSLEITKEVVRSGGWESFVETCWRDLRYAQRRLRMAPTFTIATVLTLALGIGATTSIFTLVHAVLLKSSPVVNAFVRSSSSWPAANSSSLSFALASAVMCAYKDAILREETCGCLRSNGYIKLQRFALNYIAPASCSAFFMPAQLCRVDSSAVPAPRQCVSRLTAK